MVEAAKLAVIPLGMLCWRILRIMKSPVEDVLTAVAAFVTVKVSVVTVAATFRIPVKFDWENVGSVPPIFVVTTTGSLREYP